MAIDCAIIGGGPAGLTAGIYLQRFYRSVRLLDAGNSRAALIPWTHNYPGFPDGIAGTDLLDKLRQQLTRYGGVVERVSVTKLEQDSQGLLALTCANGERILAKTVLLTTGQVDKEPDIDGLVEARQHGLIRHCPICDGYEYSGKNVGVFGADEHGLRELSFIRHFTDKLTFLSLCDDEEMEDRLARKMEPLGAHLLSAKGCRIEHHGDSNVALVAATGETYHFDGLYCALGGRTRSELALDLGAAHDGQGALEVTSHLQTTVAGLYAAGDVVSGLDQIAVAIGQAAIAATAIHNKLTNAD